MKVRITPFDNFTSDPHFQKKFECLLETLPLYDRELLQNSWQLLVDNEKRCEDFVDDVKRNNKKLDISMVHQLCSERCFLDNEFEEVFLYLYQLYIFINFKKSLTTM